MDYKLVIIQETNAEYSLGIQEISEDEYSLHLVIEQSVEFNLGVTIDPRNTHVPVATGQPDNRMIRTKSGKYELFTPGTMVGMNYWKGTEEEYDLLTPEQKADPTYIHFII